MHDKTFDLSLWYGSWILKADLKMFPHKCKDFILYILYFLRVVQKKGALVYALRVDSSYLINGRGT